MNADLSMYAVRYLNNMEIVPTKGLIVDFSMEDQRALFKRKEKIERHRKIAKENKKANALDDEEEGYKNANSIDGKMQTIKGVVDLGASDEDEVMEGEGKSAKKAKKGSINIQEITDVETLESIMKDSISRGQKQRIKKRLRKLQGIEETPKGKKVSSGIDNPNPETEDTPVVQEKKWTAKEKIDFILKKRERKME